MAMIPNHSSSSCNLCSRHLHHTNKKGCSSRQWAQGVLLLSLHLSCTRAMLMVIIIMEKRTYVFTHIEYTTSTVIIMFLLFLPLFVVIRGEFFLWKQTCANPRLVQITKVSHPLPTTTTIITTNSTTFMKLNLSNIITIFKPPKRGGDYSILQAIVRIDLLIIRIDLLIIFSQSFAVWVVC